MKLSTAEMSRLEKLVGMLGSDFEGERANAAAIIARMARERKLTIPEMLMGGARPEEPPVVHMARPRWPEGLLEGLCFALRYGEVLTEWELQFAQDVPQRYFDETRLSDRQRTAAERIIAKARHHAISIGEVDG